MSYLLRSLRLICKCRSIQVIEDNGTKVEELIHTHLRVDPAKNNRSLAVSLNATPLKVCISILTNNAAQLEARGVDG